MLTGARYASTCVLGLTPNPTPQYTANPLTPQCIGSYADLQQIVLLMLEQPTLVTPNDLAVLRGLCSATGYSSCINQLNTQVDAFLKRISAPSASACDAALAPNAASLVQLLTDFLCLQNNRGEQCFQVVATAAKDLGLTAMLTGREAFNAKTISSPSTCAALNASTCCGAALLEMLYAVAQMTCHQEGANAAQMLSSSCSGMPAPCGSFTVPSYEAVSSCRGVSMPKTCDTPPDSCPDSPCQLLCAIATNEPPAEPKAASTAAQVAQVANESSALSSVSAAAYLTTCLELGAGKPLEPQCATVYEDLWSLIPQALVNPAADPSGPEDAAVLTQLCTPPKRGQMSCMQQQLSLFIAWISAMPQPSSTVCDYVLGPNVDTLGIYATYFACLSNEDGQMCLPAVGAALNTAGLGAVLAGKAPLDVAAIDASSFCPALGSTGCCAGAFVEVVQGIFAMTCQTEQAAALSTLLGQCDGLPATCSDFQLPEVTPAASCPDSITGPPVTCSIAPNQCPSTPCEALCAYTNLQRGAPAS